MKQARKTIWLLVFILLASIVTACPMSVCPQEGVNLILNQTFESGAAEVAEWKDYDYGGSSGSGNLSGVNNGGQYSMKISETGGDMAGVYHSIVNATVNGCFQADIYTSSAAGDYDQRIVLTDSVSGQAPLGTDTSIGGWWEPNDNLSWRYDGTLDGTYRATLVKDGWDTWAICYNDSKWYPFVAGELIHAWIDSASSGGFYNNVMVGKGQTGDPMYMDNVLFWNFSEAAAPPPAESTELLLRNELGVPITTVGINENTPFYIAGNYTYDGSQATTGVCNFTAQNISAHFAKYSQNYTINSSAQRVHLEISEGNTNAVEDIIEVELCSEQGNTDIQIYKDGSIFRTIDSGVIPLCNLGTHLEINITEELTNDTNINLSVQCSACATNKRVRIVNGDELLHFDRYFSTHYEPLTYNSTSARYEYNSHLYAYKRAGVNEGNITVNCNGTTSTTEFDVIDVAPIITIISIDETAFSSGMSVESQNTTSILIEVTGDVIVSVQLNVSYENGTVIKSVSTENVTLTANDLNIDGTYNITVYAVDDEGNTSTLTDYFVLNDTTAPSITWNNPSIQNTTVHYEGDNITFNISFSDLNLFAYNISLIYPNGTVYRNWTAIDISDQYVNFSQNASLNLSGFWTMRAEVSDSHHLSGSQLLPEWNVQKTSQTLKFDNSVEIYAEGALATNTQKSDYSYNFEFYYDEKPALTRTYEVTANRGKIYYLPESDYVAHFVILEEGVRGKWVDFEGLGTKPTVLQLNATTYRVTFVTDLGQVIFNSVGGLNVIEQEATFEIRLRPGYNDPYDTLGNNTPSSFTRRIDPDTLQGIGLMFFYLAVCLIITVLGAILGSGEMVALSGLFWLFLGLIIGMNVSITFGVLVAIIGVFILLLGGFSLKNG